MTKLLQQVARCERGQALPIVLALLLVGGLTVAGSLNYATTVLNGTQSREEGVRGMYAAEAGVQHVIWSITEGLLSIADGNSQSTELAEQLNHLDVTMLTENKGSYSVVFGEMVTPGVHSDYLSLSSALVWDPAEDAYKYTVTITGQHPSTIHIVAVGARIPPGYSYRADSAALFAGENLSLAEPDETIDGQGAYLLQWVLCPPGQCPSVAGIGDEKTQSFYITGAGELQGDYGWIVALSNDIGEVGEINGTAYRITAEATRPGDSRTAARIVADVVMAAGTVHVVSWRLRTQ